MLPQQAKSFSFAQNKISERSEETLLNPIDRESNNLENVKRDAQLLFQIVTGHLTQALLAQLVIVSKGACANHRNGEVVR